MNEWLTKVITTKKLDALLEASYLIIYSLLLYLNFINDYPETMRLYKNIILLVIVSYTTPNYSYYIVHWYAEIARKFSLVYKQWTV